MPDMFQYLKEHLHFYPIQKGYCAMLGDKDNVERPFMSQIMMVDYLQCLILAKKH